MLFLDKSLLYIKEAIALIGICVIVIGAIRSAVQLWRQLRGAKVSNAFIRWQFGESVILGLEFMVGADIVGSLAEPNYYSLGLLAILVIIRTILSYFLNLELAGLTPEHKRSSM